ncbi:MAG: DUF2442 domain-containing protein [Methylovulum sp.]|nr:MAG: DUF2442 domain-containing protein [Methylovulum sp.]
MKLKYIKHRDAYRFLLVFENGETQEADLKELIGDYVSVEALNTAHIDADWGCLEFNDGRVDIEPKTLYQFVTGKRYEAAA